jgi:hypothetical protein
MTENEFEVDERWLEQQGAAFVSGIRLRPAMYIGVLSLVRLRSFPDGCFYMARKYGIGCRERPDFGGFHDWFARRFGWNESMVGWCTIIVQECGGNEDKALDCFFVLIGKCRGNAGSGTVRCPTVPRLDTDSRR